MAESRDSVLGSAEIVNFLYTFPKVPEWKHTNQFNPEKS